MLDGPFFGVYAKQITQRQTPIYWQAGNDINEDMLQNERAEYGKKIIDQAVAILRDLEEFILELGMGFIFVERQKRMILEGVGFFLDVWFCV